MFDASSLVQVERDKNGQVTLISFGKHRLSYDPAGPDVGKQAFQSISFRFARQAYGCIEEQMLHALRSQMPSMRDAVNTLQPLIDNMSRSFKSTDPEAYEIVMSYAFSARRRAWLLLRGTAPGTAARKRSWMPLRLAPPSPASIRPTALVGCKSA